MRVVGKDVVLGGNGGGRGGLINATSWMARKIMT